MNKPNYNLIIGITLASMLILIIGVGFFWTPYAPTAMSMDKLLPPSATHFLGTDNFGRDIFSRILKGLGTTLVIAGSTVSIGLGAGIIIGGLTGYFGGIVDEILMRINDTITAFPSMLLALTIISLTGPGKYNVTLALGILFTPSFTRIVRAEFARCRTLDYVQAARLMGASPFRIMYVHILPNTAPVLISSAAIGFNNAVLAEASLSFLGIGVLPPEPSLGRMLSESQTFFFSAPWYALSVGAVIVLLILSFSLISEGIGNNG